MTHKDQAVRMVTELQATTPPSFGGDTTLYAWNLFVMTAFFFIAAMVVVRQAGRIWTHRRDDHPLHPVSIWRLVILFASVAAMMRAGAEAMLLWGWNVQDPTTTARVIMAKRWIDPVSVGFGLLWMILALLGEPGVEVQLRNRPIPVDMWSRWPVLMRAMGVVVLSAVGSFAAVLFR